MRAVHEFADTSDTMVEDAIARGVPYRRWPEGLRAAWRDDQPRRRRELLFLHCIALAMNVLCLPLDYASGPQVFELGLILRLGIVAPIYGLALLAVAYGTWLQQNISTILTVPAFAVVAAVLALHTDNVNMHEYVMAIGLLTCLATVALPLRPMWLFAMTGMTFAGLWMVWALSPETQAVSAHVFLVFLSGVCLLTLAIPVRTARLKDQHFLFAVRGRMVSEKLIAANQQLRELSDLDDLTGLPNRRYFERVFDTAYTASVANENGLAVMMIDVDHFKVFNDTHGHLAGDRALRHIAQELDRHFDRSTRKVARYGGEEFIALVQDCDEASALSLADAMRQAIAIVPVVIGEGRREAVTLSIGVALRCAADLGPADLMLRADRALYEAKEAGRNLVRLARPGGNAPIPSLLKQSA